MPDRTKSGHVRAPLFLENIYDHFIGIAAEGRNFQDAFIRYTESPTNPNTSFMQKRVERLMQKGMDRQNPAPMSWDTIVTELDKEFTHIFAELFAHARTNGKSDEKSAEKALRDIPSGVRAVFVYGWGHGFSNDCPASFVDQIQKQAQMRGDEAADCEVILLMEAQYAKDGYIELSDLASAGRLRAGLKVFDYDLNLKLPVAEWLQQAGTLYPQKGLAAKSQPKP